MVEHIVGNGDDTPQKYAVIEPERSHVGAAAGCWTIILQDETTGNIAIARMRLRPHRNVGRKKLSK